MIDQPPEWTNGVKKELELYGDYKKGVGQIENPKDISKVVFAAVAKSRAITPLDEMKISCRLYSEAQDCSEEHLRRRMADLRARNMGFGSNIDDTNRLVDDARVAFRRWALSQGLGLDHYEDHPLYQEIMNLETKLLEKKPRVKYDDHIAGTNRGRLE